MSDRGAGRSCIAVCWTLACLLLWRAWPTDLASGVRENWPSADVITMALSHTEKEKEGLGADFIEKFKRGELDIPVETAKRYIRVCGEFTGKGFKCKGLHCPELHIDKKGVLRL